MKDIIEGSIAVALAVARCKPQVVPAYPITPSTHIPQELSRIQPEYGYDFVPVESEFAAISTAIGASAAGARTFTATSSQGLLLMHEALFNAAGMRLPVVMCVANRSVSAPLNIWNDWQDSISQRDAGWIQLYCKNNQEAVDTAIQAFKIAETADLPVMVCFDGFYLTHELLPLDMPSQGEVDAFLPPRVAKDVLDVEKPGALGCYAMPADYQDFRKELDEAVRLSSSVITKTAAEFGKKFKRGQTALIEEYANDKPVALVTMGSLAEQSEMIADEGLAGVVRIKCFRPFPSAEIARALQGKKKVVIIEKDCCPGAGGALAAEVKAALKDAGSGAEVIGIIAGLGGRDVTLETLRKAVAEGSDGAWM